MGRRISKRKKSKTNKRPKKTKQKRNKKINKKINKNISDGNYKKLLSKSRKTLKKHEKKTLEKAFHQRYCNCLKSLEKNKRLSKGATFGICGTSVYLNRGYSIPSDAARTCKK